MRLWLKDTERRPDPLPARTNSRTAVAVGSALWLVALVILAITADELVAGGRVWWLWCAVLGLILGVAGLVWLQLRRR
ncbi:MAG: hypothetical protein JWQ59_2148 [Cryobacterium sp.]|jgi:hypothetical protein|nr:hypothetical protein [Cryobacterium sp.]